MAWLKENKALAPEGRKVAPVTFTSGGVVRKGRTDYSEYWNVNRVVEEALKKVTWVYRCVDVIASNAARVPLLIRKDDAQDGPIDKTNELVNLLNSNSNGYETSFDFRYRLSAQLLTSPTGVYVEISRDRGGRVTALELLPPQFMKVVPDTKNFVSKYILDMPVYGQNLNYDGSFTEVGGIHREIDPEKIIWIKHPHPFDPYQSLTAMPAAGAVIETDWYARIYNRNFLLNDGRPGGLVILKGQIDPADRDELQARFRGNPAMAGRISVIGADQGADFVDTAITPRDAQYEVMRRLSKEEILLAFGVPESVMSNASGRTFDNAEAERLIFWVETMLPHMDLITKKLSILDSNDQRFVVTDLDRVDVLQRNDMKRKEYALKEFDAGTTSIGEYRASAGYKPLGGDLGKTLWMSNTRFPSGTEDGTKVDEMPNLPVGYREVQPISVGNSAGASNSQPNEGRPASSAVTTTPDKEPRTNEGDERSTPLPNSGKTDHYSEDKERWGSISQNTVKRLFERQERVLDEKIKGQKMKKLLARRYKILETEGPKSGFGGDKSLSIKTAVDTVYDINLWNKQLSDDLRPVISGVVKEFGEAEASDFDVLDEKVQSLINAYVKRFYKVNEIVRSELELQITAKASDMQTCEEIASSLPEMFESIYNEKVIAMIEKEILIIVYTITNQ